MTTYNHLFSVAFSVKSRHANWEDTTALEVWNGLADRFSFLKFTSNDELLEAVHYEGDTHEEAT